MANPQIPGITQAEQDLLYSKLSTYNQGRASYKEAGAYLVVLPRPEHLLYSLWVYSPLPERQSVFFVCDLSADVHETLRMASSLCFYSTRCLILVEYNAKRMQSKGDDIISFGKYHGHFLHDTEARTFRADSPDLSFGQSGHPTKKGEAGHKQQWALSGERRREAGESDFDRPRRHSGRQSLQNSSQRNHCLFLCTPSVETERRFRKSGHFQNKCTHGKPKFVPTACRGTCLPTGGNNKNRFRPGGTYLRGRK